MSITVYIPLNKKRSLSTLFPLLLHFSLFTLLRESEKRTVHDNESKLICVDEMSI